MTDGDRQPGLPGQGNGVPGGGGPNGWALERLLMLHGGLRSDLGVLRRSLAAMSAGDPDDGTAGDLPGQPPGWSLRKFCRGFCGFLREHHTVEDTVVFPSALEFADGPELAEVIARLEADHRELSGHVDEVERALGALAADPAAAAAATLAVDRLGELLEAHLEFEETSLAPALNALSEVVSPDDIDAPEPPAGLSEAAGPA